jgi:hypothetical protein
MAAKNPKVARWANIIAGLVLMGFSVPFGLLGGEMRLALIVWDCPYWQANTQQHQLVKRLTHEC